MLFLIPGCLYMECSLFKVALRNLHISLSVIKRAFQDVVSLLISLFLPWEWVWRDFILLTKRCYLIYEYEFNGRFHENLLRSFLLWVFYFYLGELYFAPERLDPFSFNFCSEGCACAKFKWECVCFRLRCNHRVDYTI